MKRKLVLEIAENPSLVKQANANPLFVPIAARTRPAAKVYPGGCDKYGGWGGDGP
jgi:hypothetical protein